MEDSRPVGGRQLHEGRRHHVEDSRSVGGSRGHPTVGGSQEHRVEDSRPVGHQPEGGSHPAEGGSQEGLHVEDSLLAGGNALPQELGHSVVALHLQI